ncbi:MAG TPA: TonB-dependent receptor [Erythrobacter sp.]|nr:TonB-dependent receptor [Erythrobacter sp.]
MKTFHNSSIKALAFSASAIAFAIAGPAHAQDAEDEDPIDVTEANVEEDDGGDRIVVTGSRIQRDTYTSISPLQVLTTATEQEAGLFDPSQILQRSESASGTQIDATFQGFVLDNGPGSQTLNLRGLGADRTLLLINGRRLAPAGVEGAPTNPSINLLPGSLIDRYDLLLDGASSVYGSDAVAGVGNIVLRKDFDGLELFARGEINPDGAGEDYTVSAAWGFNTDRAFFGIGAEYDYRDAIRFRDRDFFSGCNTHYEIDQDGNLYTLGRLDNAIVQDRTPGVSVSENDCKIAGISGRMFIPFTFWGSVYLQPGQGNTPITDFSESTDAFGDDLDVNGDGIRDVDFQDVNTNGQNLDQIFLSRQRLYNVMAYGEYTFPGAGNITPYFEANYSRAEIFADNNGTPQIFPYVPDNNAFNPCNIGAPTFVNTDGCGGADNIYLNEKLGLPAGTITFNPNGGFSLPVAPIVSIRGDRNNTDVTQEMYRGVVGVRGDLPFIGSSWTFDVSGVYSRSKGKSIRRGIREDKLALAIGLDPTADYNGDGIVDNDGDGIADDYDLDFAGFGFFGDPQVIDACDTSSLANPSLAMPDLAQGCTAVNLFAPSVLGAGGIGDFATAAEREYVFGIRSFDTTYEQIVASAFVTGDLIDLPAGPVGAVLGVEYRRDEINSLPDAVASNGLFFGFFADKGAVGDKRTMEAFGEIDVPLMADKPWVRELNMNFSGRITDDEFYGTNYTYSIKGIWRPVDPLLLKFSYGTSFRAPNLRENFLNGQSGFLTLFDPCAVPDAAYNALGGGYDPSLDLRDPVILENCIREGRDPTRVGIDSQGLGTIQFQSVEITTGGSLDIDPETSRSITAGFAFEETFGDGWDVSLGYNYYDIKLKDSIVEPSSQFIINDCFTRDDGQRSRFCDRLSYDTDPDSTRLLVSDVASGFINLNQESVRGMDFNATFGKEVSLFGKLVDFGLNVRANHLIERSSLFINDNGETTFDDDAGEFSLPKWTGRATLTADVDQFRLSWQIRYTGPVEQDPAGIDEFDDAFGNLGTGFISDTCLGDGTANVAGDGLFCRDVGFAKAQYLHSASIRYTADRWTFLAGVDNIFDTPPPLVDSSEVLAIANTAIGNGYDYDGREFFFSAQYEF